MATDNKHIDHLITRYLTGEATMEEKFRLENWLGQSEMNKKHFDDFRFVFDKTLTSSRLVKFDVDKAWDTVYAQMKSKTGLRTIPGTTVPIYKTTWFRVAALFIVVFGLSVWLYVNFQSSRVNELKTITLTSINSTSGYKLTDSSSVFLNRNSKINYIKGFVKRQRELKLTGEAYFKVKHEADNPFVVKAQETRVKDIGTSFNIKAYPENSTIEVYVESGEVKFYTENNPGITLTIGETGVYNKKTRIFSKLSASDVNVISYQSKVFIFRDTKLIDAIERLNQVYRSNIKLSSEKLKNCRITVTFDKENIASIVNIIAETLKLQVIKTANGFILKGNGCNGI